MEVSGYTHAHVTERPGKKTGEPLGPRGGSGNSSKEKNIRAHWELKPEFSYILITNFCALIIIYS